MKSGKCKEPKGFTLTELAIVLGIIGLILGAIWTAAAKVYQNQRVGKAVNEVLSVVGSVRAMYAGRGSFGTANGDITQFGVNAGWYPADMLQSGGACRTGVSPCPDSPWNSEMSIIAQGGYGSGVAGANVFDVIIWDNAGGGAGLPAKDCPSFMAAIVQQAASAGLTSIYSDYSSPTSIAITSSTPLTSSTITGCYGNVVLSFTL